MEVETKIQKIETEVNMIKADLVVINKVIDIFENTANKLIDRLDKYSEAITKLSVQTEANTLAISKLESKLERNDSDHNLNLPQLVKTNILAIVMFGYIILNHLGIIK